MCSPSQNANIRIKASNFGGIFDATGVYPNLLEAENNETNKILINYRPILLPTFASF